MLQISTRNAEDYQKVKKTLIENPWLLFSGFEEGQEIDEKSKKKLEKDFKSHEEDENTTSISFLCDSEVDLDRHEKHGNLDYSVQNSIMFANESDCSKEEIFQVFAKIEELSGCPIAVNVDCLTYYRQDHSSFFSKEYFTEGTLRSVYCPEMDEDDGASCDYFILDGNEAGSEYAYSWGVEIKNKKTDEFARAPFYLSPTQADDDDDDDYDDDDDDDDDDYWNDDEEEEYRYEKSCSLTGCTSSLQKLKEIGFNITDETSIDDFVYESPALLSPKEELIFEGNKNALVVVLGDTGIRPWDRIASGEYDRVNDTSEKIVVTLNNEKVVLYKKSSYIIAKILSDTEFNIDVFAKSKLCSALLKEMASKLGKYSSEVKIATMNNENYKKTSKIVVDKKAKKEAEKAAAKAKKEAEKAAAKAKKEAEKAERAKIKSICNNKRSAYFIALGEKDSLGKFELIEDFDSSKTVPYKFASISDVSIQLEPKMAVAKYCTSKKIENFEQLEDEDFFADLVRKMAIAVLVSGADFNKFTMMKIVKLTVNGKEEKIITNEKTPFLYTTIENILDVPSDVKSKEILESILKTPVSKYNKKTSMLFSYLSGVAKKYETEKLPYFWQSFNAMYSVCFEKVFADEKSKKESDKLRCLSSFLNYGKYKIEESDKNKRTAEESRISKLVTKICKDTFDFGKSYKVNAKNVIKAVSELFENEKIDLDAESYLLFNFSYAQRNRMFHAEKPVAILAKKDARFLRPMASCNAVLRCVIENNFKFFFLDGLETLDKASLEAKKHPNPKKSYEASSSTEEIEGFSLIQGDEYEIGSEDEDDNKPHKVKVDSFYVAKYQVTQELYESVIGENPSYFKGAMRPVEEVSWYDAVEFCNKLSEKEGLEPCYKIDKENEDPNNESDDDDVKWTVECDFSKNGYRLPTEAEWEIAAKGGENYKYAGSDDLNEVGWCKENSDDETHEVGQKKANGYGLFDMTGNVLEWCWDWYSEEVECGENPRGASSGSFRVFRGGSWFSDAYHSSVGYRGSYNPDGRSDLLGFRVCRSAQ